MVIPAMLSVRPGLKITWFSTPLPLPFPPPLSLFWSFLFESVWAQDVYNASSSANPQVYPLFSPLLLIANRIIQQCLEVVLL